MDDFNAIRALKLQFEMQKAGPTHGTGSFFRVIFNFSVRKIFPAALADAAFHSPTAAGAARSRLAAAALYSQMLLLPLKASNLRSVRFFGISKLLCLCFVIGFQKRNASVFGDKFCILPLKLYYVSLHVVQFF